MKRFIGFLVCFLVFSASGSTINAAPIFDYEYYNVDIDISKDSTYTVTESYKLIVNGEFHGLRRDIPTDNFCTVATLTCGGFDNLEILEVRDLEGTVLNEDQYSLYTYEDEDTNENFLRIERELYPNGKEMTDEEEGWTIKYKVYGGLGTLNDGTYFYWNVLPENRGGQAEEANITINFPTGIRESDLTLYDLRSYTNRDTISGNTLNIELKDLPSVSNFTVAYRFNENEINKPATLITGVSPSVATTVKLNNLTVDSLPVDVDYLPAGKYLITVSHFGYDTLTREVNLEAGEVLDLGTLKLEATPGFAIVILGSNFLMILFCLLLPFAVILVYWLYSKRGKDMNPLKTVIPLFSPPENVKPYLGSNLYYEKFKPKIIAATIVDLAVKGIITIKQLDNGKDFTLTRVEEESKYAILTQIENDILDLLFDGQYIVNTVNFKTPSTTRALKYAQLMKDSYAELVNLKYFQSSPETIRASYAGIAIFLVVLGILLTCGGTILMTTLGGFFFVCTPGIWLTIFGFSLAVTANFMPAKTAAGSKVFNDLKGFRMYLYTAERFRLQGLNPEEFEKYLPYAMIFDIEKQWAEKFKDLYNHKPEWYEGDVSTFNAIYLANSISNFSSSITTQSLGSAVSNTSGSGWSGSGGSFGGFSGGGGGGGSSGGW
jgi:uncharacterized membrane protein YgcG